MRLRTVAASAALVMVLGCVPARRAGVASPQASPSSGQIAFRIPVPLELRTSDASVTAGTCVRLTVSAPRLGASIARIRGAGTTLRLREGRGSSRLCPTWQPQGGHLELRVTAEHARPSDVVRIRVRPAAWMTRIERLVGALPISVSVGERGRTTYSHLGEIPRAPASNQKLLLSMALLDRFGPRFRIATTAESPPHPNGVVAGDLWIVGHGDPEVGSSTIRHLAHRIRSTGVRTIRGSVVGDRSTFSRERWAPGWHRIALQFISIPTALTFNGNQDAAGFIFDPERRAAEALTEDLRSFGIHVRGPPDTGRAPESGLEVDAAVRSAPLVDLLRRQNVGSINLSAEVLAKALGASASGEPGAIESGAAEIAAWAARHGVTLRAHDGSGLSYANRITTDGMVRLLGMAARSPSGSALRSTLPIAGEGTLAGRLTDVPVRAKTGTLIEGVSALSGWVRRQSSNRWTEFSILSAGLSKDQAIGLEDRILEIVAGSRARMNRR